MGGMSEGPPAAAPAAPPASDAATVAVEPTGLFGRLIAPRGADRPVPRWHVSPAIDLLAYHWSWLFVLIPMALAGTDRYRDYLPWFILIALANFLHRHTTLPYAFLDSEVLGRYRWRLLVPAFVLTALFLASPWIEGARAGLGGVLIGSVLVAGAVWNVWHFYMQKFGILRLYDGKAGDPERVPGWNDRLLLLAWMPLYLAWLAPYVRDNIEAQLPSYAFWLVPMADLLARWGGALIPLGAALVVAAVALWVRAEWRCHRLRSGPRLSMVVATTALAASFLVFDPVKVFLAFSFSHSVEYMVFVWAFQRRRYHRPLGHEPFLGRLLRRPLLFYGFFFGYLTGAYFLASWWGTLFLVDSPPGRIAGLTLGKWVFYWGSFQALLHFWADGFLWKMRRPEVRQAC